MMRKNRTKIVMTLVVLTTAICAGLPQAGAVEIADPLGILTPETLAADNPATGAPWQVGDSFRYVFVSSTVRDATSPDIDDYNTFVQNTADASTLDLSGAAWKVIGSSETVDAISNTSTDPALDGEAIFLLDGSTLVTDGYAGLWSSVLINGISLDESGKPREASNVHTGTDWSGTQAGTRYFGTTVLEGNPPAPKAEIGLSSNASWRWIRVYNTRPTTELPFYGLSDPLTIVESSLTPPGDFNLDLKVDQGDLSLLLSNWGRNTGEPPEGWHEEAWDPAVDQEELSALLANWGAGTGAAAVPEPSTFVLLGMGLLGLVALVRRKR